MRVNVWGPLPPSPSGIADYLAEQLEPLARHVELTAVVEDPGAVAPALHSLVPIVAPSAAPLADLDLYQIGNSPAHAYVYRAALRQPGIVVLHDFGLHHLVLQETVERGDKATYLRLMRRAYREPGVHLGRHVAAGLGGQMLPALLPLSEHLLDASLAVVGLSRSLTARVARVLPGRPLLHLPHHLALPLTPLPTRAEARRALGIPADALVVTAPGLATAAKSLHVAVRVAARLRATHPTLRLVVAGAIEPGLALQGWSDAAGLGAGLVVTGRTTIEDFVRHLVAADVVLALRFPSHGEMSGAVVRALGVGRPVLVTAGTPAAEEFPGLVATVDPGVREESALEATLAQLLAREDLRERMGRLSALHVRRAHALDTTTTLLAGFLKDVQRQTSELSLRLRETLAAAGSLEQYLLDELRPSVRELRLQGTALGLRPLVAGLCSDAS
jgi:glycosyltransferase involved in cell wall biosynthesis